MAGDVKKSMARGGYTLDSLLLLQHPEAKVRRDTVVVSMDNLGTSKAKLEELRARQALLKKKEDRIKGKVEATAMGGAAFVVMLDPATAPMLLHDELFVSLDPLVMGDRVVEAAKGSSHKAVRIIGELVERVLQEHATINKHTVQLQEEIAMCETAVSRAVLDLRNAIGEAEFLIRTVGEKDSAAVRHVRKRYAMRRGKGEASEKSPPGKVPHATQPVAPAAPTVVPLTTAAHTPVSADEKGATPQPEVATKAA